MLKRLTDLFAVWAVLASLGAYVWPEPLVALKDSIVLLLGVVMLAMGMTLSAKDFLLVLRRPKVVVVGTLLQFLLMPLFAFAVSRGLFLEAQLLTGMVLVGSCPGGTASNVVTFLARGDVALSITLTSVSTLLAVLVTPLSTWLYLNQTIDVPVGAMLLSVLKIVLAPVTAGVLLNTFLSSWTRRLKPYLAPLSVLAIVLIIAIIVALTRDRLASVGLATLFAVALHNGLGLGIGFAMARWFGFSAQEQRTLAIEVGMQNSGLGVALATQHFSAIAALPGAVFSVWHNLSGSLLASVLSRRDRRREP